MCLQFQNLSSLGLNLGDGSESIKSKPLDDQGIPELKKF